MDQHDVRRLAVALEALGETFNEPVSAVRAEAYLLALEEFSIVEVEQACRHAIKHGKFFPRPAELRQLIEGSAEDQAELAWLELVREVRRTGYTGRPALPPSTLDAIDRVWGSWVALCQTLPAEGPGLHAWAKRFRETYQVLSTRNRMELASAPNRPQLTE